MLPLHTINHPQKLGTPATKIRKAEHGQPGHREKQPYSLHRLDRLRQIQWPKPHPARLLPSSLFFCELRLSLVSPLRLVWAWSVTEEVVPTSAEV